MRPDVLLPGVTRGVERRSTPAYDRHAVNVARQKEDLRDLIDLLVLAAVDVMAFSWEAAHVPLMSRESTMQLLLAANAVMGGFVLVRRLIPVLRARRIASTWSENERSRD